jgi:nitroimidazol reductase NimA-like FMN-containing flavoprotein (pyridoxamine 5'-phosphate oxidase superfamily)
MAKQKEADIPGEPRASRPQMPEGYGVPRGARGMLPWSHASDLLASAKNYWVATVRPDGRPHTVPVWGNWIDGTFYVGAGPETRRGRNLASNPAMSVHIEKGDEVVILEGTAEEVTNPGPDLVARLIEDTMSKYKYKTNPSDWQQGGFFAVRPRVVLAWSDFPRSATRWHFP